MIIRFIYRYYYTFFLLHKKTFDAGKIKADPWYRTLVQVGGGIGCAVMGSLMFLAYVFGSLNEVVQNKMLFNKFYGILIVAVLPFLLLYHLLYNIFGVDKATGLTEKYTFTPNKVHTALFWVLWIMSMCFPFFMGAIANGRIKF